MTETRPFSQARKFIDNLGRPWLVDVNISSIKSVRDQTEGEVNLFAVIEKKGALMQRLATDPELLVNVVYLLVKPQADALGVSDVQFGEGMAGDSIDAATDALLDSLTYFFRKGQRALVEAAVAKMRKFQDRGVELGLERINSADFDAAVERELQKEITGELSALSGSAGS